MQAGMAAITKCATCTLLRRRRPADHEPIHEANVVAEPDFLSRVSSLIVALLLHALLAILVPAAFHVRLAPQGTPNIGFRCACFRSVSDLVLRYQTSGIAARHKTYSLQLV